MAVKYRLLYKDYFNQTCICEISKEAYTGEPIPIKGIEGQAVIIERDCGDDPYEPIVNTKATINVYQEEHSPIDVFELQTAEDREFSVTFTVNGQVKFKGWLNADGLQQPLKGAPFELQLIATDGLSLLTDIPYIHNNLTGGQCIINYIRQILLGIPNLNSDLPVRWFNNIKNLEWPTEDVMSGSVRWSTRGEGYNDYNGTLKDCMYILEGMLRSMQCRIVQSEGKWTIYRINDFIDSTVVFNELVGLSDFNITTSSYSKSKTIGNASDDYHMVLDDQITMVSPALKRVATKYEQNQRDNILPNGNMDLFSFGVPIHWKLLNNTLAYMEQNNSLSNARGYSVKINNVGGAANIFMLQYDNLPIDTDVLYSYINFGFKFVIEAGAIIDSNGIIQWGDQSRFTVQLMYDAGDGVIYHLNEFGFWTETLQNIYIDVPNLKQGDVAQVDFNAHQDIKIPLPEISPIERTTEPSLFVGFNLQPGLIISFDDIYITTDNNNDVYEAVYGSDNNTAKEEYTLDISSSHNGFYLSNYMTNYATSGVEKFYTDGISTGTLTELNSRAIIRNRYQPSIIFEGSIYAPEYRYSELYTIRGMGDKKFLPLRSEWNTETNTIRLTCIESRNDNVGISVTHYGSNDKVKLSN